MAITRIIDAFGYVIYAALALLAVWGVYNAILLYRGLAKKSIRDARPLLERVKELCLAGRHDDAPRPPRIRK
jgi:biopolymer transport protein ExbB